MKRSLLPILATILLNTAALTFFADSAFAQAVITAAQLPDVLVALVKLDLDGPRLLVTRLAGRTDFNPPNPVPRSDKP